VAPLPLLFPPDAKRLYAFFAFHVDGNRAVMKSVGSPPLLFFFPVIEERVTPHARRGGVGSRGRHSFFLGCLSLRRICLLQRNDKESSSFPLLND